MRRNSNNISDLIGKFEARERNDFDEVPRNVSAKRIKDEDSSREKAKKINSMESNEEVVTALSRIGRFLDFLSRLPLPIMSVTGMGITFFLAVFIFPRAITENFLFPAFRLLFGTLYPAYASYKAVRTKNVKEYVSKII